MAPPSVYDPKSANEQPVPLPSAPLTQISSHLHLQPPLSRRGQGPGLILFAPDYRGSPRAAGTLDPLPVKKWAEEGYAIAWIEADRLTTRDIQATLDRACQVLVQHDSVDQTDSVAVLGMLSVGSARATLIRACSI